MMMKHINVVVDIKERGLNSLNKHYIGGSNENRLKKAGGDFAWTEIKL